jgi:2-hydroxy-6-oxonona-2,4-dienedioate hydrolase
MDQQRYREVEQRLWAEEGATPIERFVRLPRHGVEVRVQEVGEGPPVLFIHGGPNAGSTWAPLVARLPGLRCLVLDRPGCGLSGPYTYTRESLREHFETLVPDVLDALGIDQAHMVGSSSGSDFILVASARHPDRVLRTVHHGCPGFAPGIQIPFSQRVVSIPGLWRVAAWAMPVGAKSLRSMMRMLGHGASMDAGLIPDTHLEWFSALFRHTPTLTHELQGAATMLNLKGFHPWLLPTPEDFAAIRSPTLFFWGENDNFGGPSLGRDMAKLMPDAQVESLPRAGHLPWLDDCDRSAMVTRSFILEQEALSDVPATAAT